MKINKSLPSAPQKENDQNDECNYYDHRNDAGSDPGFKDTCKKSTTAN
jgi:hypothetical protein